MGRPDRTRDPIEVLRSEGVAITGGKADPTDTRDPIELLRSEGVAITGGKADPGRILLADDLVALLDQ